MPLVVVDPRRRRPGSSALRHRRDGWTIVRDVDLAPTLYELDGRRAARRSRRPFARAGARRARRSRRRLAFAETGLWFTEDIPGLPSELRLPYPGIARLTEVDTQHGDEVVLQKAMRPLTLVAKHRMVRDERCKLVYVPTRAGVRWMLFDTREDPGEERDVAVSASRRGRAPARRALGLDAPGRGHDGARGLPRSARRRDAARRERRRRPRPARRWRRVALAGAAVDASRPPRSRVARAGRAAAAARRRGRSRRRVARRGRSGRARRRRRGRRRRRSRAPRRSTTRACRGLRGENPSRRRARRSAHRRAEPRARRGRCFQSYWRKMRGPWAAASGVAARARDDALAPDERRRRRNGPSPPRPARGRPRRVSGT